MKRYVKPDLYYENFELSRSVASCDEDNIARSNFHNGSTCVIDMYGGIYLFSDSNTACNAKINTTGYEEYCYQKGSNGYTCFSS